MRLLACVCFYSPFSVMKYSKSGFKTGCSGGSGSKLTLSSTRSSSNTGPEIYSKYSFGLLKSFWSYCDCSACKASFLRTSSVYSASSLMYLSSTSSKKPTCESGMSCKRISISYSIGGSSLWMDIFRIWLSASVLSSAARFFMAFSYVLCPWRIPSAHCLRNCRSSSILFRYAP